MTEISLDIVDAEPRRIRLHHGLVAGWTGRDETAVRHHIAELEALGVSPPSEFPLYYRIATQLFTTQDRIETVGATGSGEVEPVILDDGNELLLGLGSDHTDRELEAQSVALSKQVCPKPLAASAWRLAEVVDHLDEIEMRSWIRDDTADAWCDYQNGTLATIKPLADLVAASPVAARQGHRLAAGTAMMCGTFAVLDGGIRPARHFSMAMHDPVLNRTLRHAYTCEWLPVVS